ncbi:MAG: hypothetical protein ABRQ39_03545 [Candidatus Eremiobacterota bacterium]
MSDRNTVKINEINKIETIPALIGDEKIEFSQDGTMLLGIDSRKSFKVYDIEKKSVIRSYYTDDCIDCTDFSPDGKFFASPGSSLPSSINVWYTEDKKLLKTFEGHCGSIDSICFASNEAFISLANVEIGRTAKVEIKIWDLLRGRCVRTFLEASLIKAKKIFSSPDGNFLIVIYPRKIKIFSSSTGDFIAVLEGLYMNIDTLSFSPDGEKMATINRKNKIKIWKTDSGKRIKELQLEDKIEIKQSGFSPDGNSIMFITIPDNKFRMFDVKTGEKLFEMELNGESEIAGFCISSNGRYLAAQFKGEKSFTVIYEIIWEGESTKVFSDFENFLASGKNYLKQGILDRAQENFKNALSIKGQEENPDVLEAIRICETRIKANASLKTADDFFKNKSYEKAEDIYRELIKIEELDARARFLISDKLEDIKLLRNVNDFSKIFRMNNIKEGEDPLLPYGVYFVLYKEDTGKFLNYTRYLSKVTELSAEIWNMSGYAYSAGMNFYSALESFKKAHILEPENKGYHRNYAWSLYYNGNYSDSFYEFKKLYDTIKDDEILIDMAVVMTGKDKSLTTATDTFLEILGRNQGSPRANLYLGELLTGMNDFFPTFFNASPDREKSEIYLKKAEELAPHLLRIKSSLKYSSSIFKNLSEEEGEYSDRDFLSLLYKDSPRGRNWSVLETYLGQHQSNVRHIEFSKSGNIFLTIGEKNDRIFYYICQERRWVPKSLDLEKTGISSIALSRKGEYMALCGKGENIHLWNMCGGEYKFVKTWRSLQKNINRLFFIKGGTQLFSAGKNQILKLWDVQSGICLKTFKEDCFHLSCIDISSDERKIASADTDRTIKLWDIETAKCTATFSRHSSPVICVRFSPDNKFLISADNDGEVKFWNIADEKCINTISMEDKIMNMKFSPDGNFIFISGKEISVWNLRKNSRETFDFFDKGITAMAISPDGNIFITGDHRGVVKTWHRSVINEQNYRYYHTGHDLIKFNSFWKEKDIRFEYKEKENENNLKPEKQEISQIELKNDKEEKRVFGKTWDKVMTFFTKQ